MELEPESICRAPSLERVEWFEQTYRLVLPVEYKAFLGQANGAVPKTKQFNNGAVERIVERFLPLFDDPKAQGEVGWLDITVVISQLDSRLIDNEDLVGMNVIPIAALFGGDFVCLDFRAGKLPIPVAVWSHETSDDFRPDLVKVADSFNEFIDRLS